MKPDLLNLSVQGKAIDRFLMAAMFLIMLSLACFAFESSATTFAPAGTKEGGGKMPRISVLPFDASAPRETQTATFALG